LRKGVYAIADLQIEIDQVRRDRQVSEITQAEYFQTIKVEAKKFHFEESSQTSMPTAP
jgi:hypothetical protein